MPNLQLSDKLQTDEMFSLKADNIYSVAKPLHFCSQLTGLTSFSITRKNGLFVTIVNCFDVFCVIISSTLYSVIAIKFLLNKDAMWDVNQIATSSVFEDCMFIIIMTFFLNSILTIWWSFGARKYFADIFNLLQEVDEELVEIKVPVNLRHQKKVILMFVTFVKLLTTCSLYLTSQIGADVYYISTILLIAMLFTIELTIFNIFQFSFIMWTVKLRYKKINLFLKENFLNSENRKIVDGNKKLDKVAILHDKLVDICESVNRCYGFPVRML